MRQSTDVQKIIRLRYVHLLEKYVGHIPVKMLTGMNDDLRNSGFLQNARNRGSLNELWPGSYDSKYFQWMSRLVGNQYRIVCLHQRIDNVLDFVPIQLRINREGYLSRVVIKGHRKISDGISSLLKHRQ